jgi:hypothetical protein
MGTLPYETSLDEVLLKIRETYGNPNVGRTSQVVLKDGPRAYKIATILEIKNPRTGEIHHHDLKIDHIDRTKRRGWFSEPDRSVRLTDDKEGDSEIHRLHMALSTLYSEGPDRSPGDYRVLTAEDYEKLENVLKAIPSYADSDKLKLVGSLINQIDAENTSLDDYRAIFEVSSGETLKHIATASRMVEYRAAYDEMRRLIDDPETTETQLQRHLERHPWMFGSEYSELLSRRVWTRDDKQDFMLRRTVDDYLEIVEIKKAFTDSLFVYDQSHNGYYPSANLSPVIGQVTRYIEEIERKRDAILASDDEETLKIRARAIVGRSGSPEHLAALHNLNSHLHRIEIMTFDQLLRIAKRVISVFEQGEAEELVDHEDDIPF